MVSDVLVDDEALVVTSGIFRLAGAQSFGGTHRGRVCVRIFIGCECACVLWASSLYCVILKKSTVCSQVDGNIHGIVNVRSYRTLLIQPTAVLFSQRL